MCEAIHKEPKLIQALSARRLEPRAPDFHSYLNSKRPQILVHSSRDTYQSMAVQTQGYSARVLYLIPESPRRVSSQQPGLASNRATLEPATIIMELLSLIELEQIQTFFDPADAYTDLEEEAMREDDLLWDDPFPHEEEALRTAYTTQAFPSPVVATPSYTLACITKTFSSTPRPHSPQKKSIEDLDNDRIARHLRLATAKQKKANHTNISLQSCWTNLAQGLEQGVQNGPTTRVATMPRNPNLGNPPTSVQENVKGIL